MRYLYFVRHGVTEANVNGVWSGTSETPLTKEGIAQAKVAGQHAQSLGIDHIICSPLGRAHETAKLIAKEIGYPEEKIELNSLFIERHFGDMEGQRYEVDADVDGFIDVEPRDTVLERAKLALEHLESLQYQTILVVSHGSFGRAIRSLLNPEQPYGHRSPSNRLKNAEIVRFI